MRLVDWIGLIMLELGIKMSELGWEVCNLFVPLISKVKKE